MKTPGNASLFLILVISISVDAATLRVEQDGTGDHTSLFAATMAAGENDTVLVGAGRFDEVGT